jgi:hypothetical protein
MRITSTLLLYLLLVTSSALYAMDEFRDMMKDPQFFAYVLNTELDKAHRQEINKKDSCAFLAPLNAKAKAESWAPAARDYHITLVEKLFGKSPGYSSMSSKNSLTIEPMD